MGHPTDVMLGVNTVITVDWFILTMHETNIMLWTCCRALTACVFVSLPIVHLLWEVQTLGAERVFNTYRGVIVELGGSAITGMPAVERNRVCSACRAIVTPTLSRDHQSG
jgi:hypothetical protein